MEARWIYFHTNTSILQKQGEYICILYGACLVCTRSQQFKIKWVIIIWNKPKNNNMKRVCIIEIMYIYFMICNLILWLIKYMYKMYCNVCEIMFVLTDPRLITYIRVVSIEGKQVPDAWWDVRFCWAGLWKVWVWSVTAKLLFSALRITKYVIFKFTLMVWHTVI